MDFLKLFKDAHKIQEQFNQKQAELEALTFEGEAGAGMVKALVNGRQDVVKIIVEVGAMQKIGESAVADLIAGAVNDALKKSKEHAKTGMLEVFQNLGLNPPNL